MSTTIASILSVISNETASPSLSYVPTTPEWMVEFIAFRQRLFLKIVEPIIVMILPYEDDIIGDSKSLKDSATDFSGENYEHRNETMHRRLGFLPDYVENASSVRETSMSFSTLITLFVTMSCILLIFLSCFYHNQKTSPLFISPRRHRLPKLVPPPLPVEGYFDWVSSKIFEALYSKLCIVSPCCIFQLFCF